MVLKMTEPTETKTEPNSAVSNILGTIVALILGFFWLLGFVIAKGAWSTGFCIIPFYAWYLVVERFAQMHGWV